MMTITKAKAKTKADATNNAGAVNAKAKAAALVTRSLRRAELASKGAALMKKHVAKQMAPADARPVATAETKPADTNVLNVAVAPGEDQDGAMARVRVHPVVTAGRTIRCFEKTLAENNFQSLADELTRHVEDIKAGKMNRPEAMLICQAHTLDTIFNNLASRAAMCLEANNIARAEIYLRLGLKAQSACRGTLLALNELKYPRATFIKQKNNASLQQVVNKGQAAEGSGFD